MMILRSTPPSPFGRKVKIAAHVLGLNDKLSVVMADTTDASDSLREQNPLGKVPVLIMENGAAIYDSRVIVEYLDALAGGGKIIPAGSRRFEALTLQALADGIMDAAILQVYEGRWRPQENHDARWLAYQAEKVTRGLKYLEAAPPSFSKGIHIGHITLACALDYLSLRFPGSWETTYPALQTWLSDFAAQVPAFNKTKPA